MIWPPLSLSVATKTHVVIVVVIVVVKSAVGNIWFFSRRNECLESVLTSGPDFFKTPFSKPRRSNCLTFLLKIPRNVIITSIQVSDVKGSFS